MKKIALGLSATAAGLFAMAQSAAACATGGLSCTPTTAVPEISALEGTAALAALAAIVLLVWERRRSAS